VDANSDVPPPAPTAAPKADKLDDLGKFEVVSFK